MTAHHHHRREDKKKKLYRKMMILIGGLLGIGILAGLMYHLEQSQQVLNQETSKAEASILVKEIGGELYRAKTRVKTYLFMGIDMIGPANDDDDDVEDDWEGSGQCDVLQLVVIDQNADTYTILPINRDTITAVDTIDEEGNYIATTDVQIALAHGHGDGKEISCENAVKAVSNYLDGLEIDGYVALNINAIEILNEMAGGVEVTIEDDFSQVDPTMELGKTITLTGKQAEYFVRSRMNVADGTNENRMKRQSVYRDKLEQIYRQKMSEDETFALDLYDALQDYMVTSFTRKDCSKLAKAMLKDESLGEVNIDGEITTGRFGYREFIPDADSLQEVIIQLFYEKV